MSMEAQNDMILYMKDLMEEGLSEQETFERAKEALKFRSETTESTDLKKRFEEYYENLDIAHDEAIGFFYAAFMFIGFILVLLLDL